MPYQDKEKQRQAQKEWVIRNREKYIKYHKEYNVRYKERRNAYQRHIRKYGHDAWDKWDSERYGDIKLASQTFAEQTERRRKYAREYYRKHRDKLLQQKKDREARVRDIKLETEARQIDQRVKARRVSAAYRERNRDKILAKERHVAQERDARKELIKSNGGCTKKYQEEYAKQRRDLYRTHLERMGLI